MQCPEPACTAPAPFRGMLHGKTKCQDVLERTATGRSSSSSRRRKGRARLQKHRSGSDATMISFEEYDILPTQIKYVISPLTTVLRSIRSQHRYKSHYSHCAATMSSLVTRHDALEPTLLATIASIVEEDSRIRAPALRHSYLTLSTPLISRC